MSAALGLLFGALLILASQFFVLQLRTARVLRVLSVHPEILERYHADFRFETNENGIRAMFVKDVLVAVWSDDEIAPGNVPHRLDEIRRRWYRIKWDPRIK
jgi:hypothetical protein